ncbi:DNA primase family protein [Enterococcus sp. AZ102]|uniref:DNA primase family protein n=1 Tax=Enterococcus sp. AZ102 TaxID=2774865 RepID=UPI003F1E811F
MDKGILEFIESEQEEINKQAAINTMAKLKSRLQEAGEQWREEHTTFNEKTGKEKVPNVTPRAVADILRRECNFILIDEDNPELSPLAAYDLDSGIYQKGERFINRLSLSVERTLNVNACNTIVHYMTNECDERKRTKDKNLIVVNNGIYNRKLKQLEPFSSEYVFVNKVATNYVKNAPEPQFEDWNFTGWIKELSDGDHHKEKLLWQLFFVAINANYISEISIFFLSEQGRTGKSTFQQLLTNLVGKQNTASLKIKEFESDFKLASAYGKSLVIGDDNNPKDFNETSENFKSVVTGDSVLLNPKGREPFTTTLTPFVVQSMNGLPRFKDITDGMQRRLRVLLFNHSYKGTGNNRRIKEEYIYDHRLLEYILSKVIDLEFDEVEDTEESRQAIHELVVENSAVLAFFEEMFCELESDRLPMKFLFKLFQAWSAYENQPTTMKQNTFTKELKSIVEKDGWTYIRNNVAPLHHFYQVDLKQLEKLDIHYKFRFDVDTHKKQPLIEKDSNK